MSDEEEFDDNEELDDEFEDEISDDLGDDDFGDGPLDEDLEIEDEEEVDERPPSRSSNQDDLQSLDYEQALKVNPKRAKMLRKRARRIEGILDDSELKTPEGAGKAWATLSESTDTDISRTYNVADDYSENDVLEHPKFGIGFVVEIMSDRKISVLFEDGLRRLVYNVKK